nr:Chain C, HIV-1 GAG PEPTIDE (GGKKKYRL - 7R MUTATION)
GGKKKYRL